MVHVAHRYVPLRFLCIMIQLVVTVALYLDRERSLYSGLDYARELTAAPRDGWTIPAGRKVVITEYSVDQIATANRWFNLLVGGSIACLVVELFGFFTGYSILSPLVCCLSIFFHVLGCVTTFMTVTDGWYYPYFWLTAVVFSLFPAATEVSVIIRQCLCNMKVLRFIDLQI